MRTLSKHADNSVAPDRRRIVHSNWDVVQHERNKELSSPDVNGGAIIFRVKRCLHYEEMFEMVSM